MTFTHRVTWRHLHVGQEVHTIRDGNITRFGRWFVKSTNISKVVLYQWRVGGQEESVPTSVIFEVEMTAAEIRKAWLPAAKLVREALSNSLNYDEIGYHEMANGFLSHDLMWMAKYCADQEFSIVGVCYDIPVPHMLSPNDILDIGICAEYVDGDRFWVHWRRSSLQNAIDRFDEILAEEKNKHHE